MTCFLTYLTACNITALLRIFVSVISKNKTTYFNIYLTTLGLFLYWVVLPFFVNLGVLFVFSPSHATNVLVKTFIVLNFVVFSLTYY